MCVQTKSTYFIGLPSYAAFRSSSAIEFIDAALDVVADLANTFDRFVLRVGELPGDVALAGDHRAGVVAGRDDHIRPVDRLLVEPVRDVVGGVDPDLLERLEHLRMGGSAWVAAGGAYGWRPPAARREQSLGHHAAAAVRGADEEDVHAASSVAGAISRRPSADRACSPRTNWYASPPSDAPITGAVR